MFPIPAHLYSKKGKSCLASFLFYFSLFVGSTAVKILFIHFVNSDHLFVIFYRCLFLVEQMPVADLFFSETSHF